MSNQEFLNWLDDQDYWVQDERWQEKADELDVKITPIYGITIKMKDGKPATPSRDIRHHMK